MYSIGLDISLTCTGMAAIDAEGYLAETASIKTKPATGVVDRSKRYGHIADQIVSFITFHSPCNVYIEGYACGSRTWGVQDRVELGGVIRHQIVTCCPDVRSITEIAPTSLKKRITGSGKGGGKEGKKIMVESVNEIFGYDLMLSTTDEADAVGLALCCGGFA